MEHYVSSRGDGVLRRKEKITPSLEAVLPKHHLGKEYPKRAMENTE